MNKLGIYSGDPRLNPRSPDFLGRGLRQGGKLPFAGNFARGGVVPGPVGAPALAQVHGGEVIGQPAPLIHIDGGLNVYDEFDERALAHKLAWLLEM